MPEVTTKPSKAYNLEGYSKPVNPPTGCRFCTRCFKAQDICRKQHPELKQLCRAIMSAVILVWMKKERVNNGQAFIITHIQVVDYFCINYHNLFILRFMPADPISILIDPKMGPEVQAQMIRRFGLDKSVLSSTLYFKRSCHRRFRSFI